MKDVMNLDDLYLMLEYAFDRNMLVYDVYAKEGVVTSRLVNLMDTIMEANSYRMIEGMLVHMYADWGKREKACPGEPNKMTHLYVGQGMELDCDDTDVIIETIPQDLYGHLLIQFTTKLNGTYPQKDHFLCIGVDNSVNEPLIVDGKINASRLMLGSC